MKNVAHLSVGFYLLLDTELTQEEFQNKVHKETIAGSKVELRLPDGTTYKASLADLTMLNIVDFEDNIEDEKEKATKQ